MQWRGGAPPLSAKPCRASRSRQRRPLAPCARPLDPAVHTGRQPLRLGIKLRRASSPAGVAPPASVGKPRRWKSTAASAGLAASRRTAHRLLRRVLGLPAFDGQQHFLLALDALLALLRRGGLR